MVRLVGIVGGRMLITMGFVRCGIDGNVRGIGDWEWERVYMEVGIRVGE